ncbi:MAG: thioredoxin [Tatlockia sp.]|nr:thioredoxin [Tatlockia sp.]
MPIYTIDSKKFDSFINTNDIVFVDFWAEWCAPCKQFAHVFERVAEENPTIKFTKINIEEDSEFAESFQIRSIPHLMVFKQGILIYSDAGSMPESTLKDLVQQALSIDVSEIRSKLDSGEII